jgi:hypothetical protein
VEVVRQKLLLTLPLLFNLKNVVKERKKIPVFLGCIKKKKKTGSFYLLFACCWITIRYVQIIRKRKNQLKNRLLID